VQQLVRSFEESKKAEMFRGQTHRRLEKLKADKLYVSCLLRVRCTRLLPPADSRFTPACCALAPCSFPYACASFSVFSRVRACLCGCVCASHAHRCYGGACEWCVHRSTFRRARLCKASSHRPRRCWMCNATLPTQPFLPVLRQCHGWPQWHCLRTAHVLKYSREQLARHNAFIEAGWQAGSYSVRYRTVPSAAFNIQ
jgi:hypothetical protein